MLIRGYGDPRFPKAGFGMGTSSVDCLLSVEVIRESVPSLEGSQFV